MKERGMQKPPQIINELNANLENSAMTVESLAEKIGISKATLYRWVRKDAEFLEALEIINEVQKDDPFRTGRPEDSIVNAGIIALLLLETKERIYKRKN
jgi:AcrR family transcriptional regulator